MLPAELREPMNAVGVGSWIIMFLFPAILSMSGRYFSVSGDSGRRIKKYSADDDQAVEFELLPHFLPEQRGETFHFFSRR